MQATILSVPTPVQHVHQETLADKLIFAQKNDDGLSEMERIALIETFGNAQHTDAFDWVWKQAWRYGYEHQSYIALTNIDYAKAASCIKRKIVEAESELNKNVKYPFNSMTLGLILDSIYQKESASFIKNYDLIKVNVETEFLYSALQFVTKTYREKVSELIGVNYKDACAWFKKSLNKTLYCPE